MVFQMSIDKENGGLYFIRGKCNIQICFYFIALRFFWISEDVLHHVIYLTKKQEAENE